MRRTRNTNIRKLIILGLLLLGTVNSLKFYPTESFKNLIPLSTILFDEELNRKDITNLYTC